MDHGYQSDSSDMEEPLENVVHFQSFDSLKESGNKLFKQTFQDNALSLTQYKEQMCQALQYYHMACYLAKNNKELSSIRKNMAVSQFHIVQKIAQCNLQNTALLTKEFKFFVENSLDNFEIAIGIGKLVQETSWILQLTETQRKCADFMWNFLISKYGKMALCVMFGRLHQFCWSVNEPSLRANLFLKLGLLTFQKAVELQENKKHIESLQLLHDNRLNIEEAKRMSSQLGEATELEESTYIHLCIGDSAKALQKGDYLWKGATCREEEIQMELTWDAVDCYLQSIVLSRSKCLESEAIAHSQLGRLYELLMFNDKSREHYTFTIQLAMAMHPKICKYYSWYKQASIGLVKFQAKQNLDEKKEKESVRAPIRTELKQILDELKKASEQSAQELLNLIYAKHPPKRGTKSTDPTIRSRYKMALLHYHPDKQDLEEHGLRWIVLSEEITVLLTYHFERMKSDPELENASKQEDSSESGDSNQCEDDVSETDSWQTVDSWTTEDSCDCNEDAQETGSPDTTSESGDASDSEDSLENGSRDTTSESGDSSDSEDGACYFQDFIISKKLAEHFEYLGRCDCPHKPLEQMDADSVKAAKDEASADLLRWKESGLSGSFFSIKCRSIRIGSYRFTPVDRVLFSPEGLMVRAPVFNTQETNKPEWISVNLPMQHLLQVKAHFNQELLVIFLHYAPTLCSSVSAELQFRENGDCWDSLSVDESQKLLTLFPCCLDESLKNAIKETFDCKGIFHEISTSDAYKSLFLSSLSEH